MPVTTRPEDDRALRGRLGLGLGLAAVGALGAWAWVTFLSPSVAAPKAPLIPPGVEVTHPAFTIETAEGPLDLGGLYEDEALVLYFGFLSCPDACPTTLATANAAVSALREDVADRVNVVFVSVDPERDTPEAIGRYVAHFHEDFRGGTVPDVEALRSTAAAWGAGFRYVPVEGGLGYTVDHTTDAIVVFPGGEIVERMPHGTEMTEWVVMLRDAAEHTP